RQPELDTEAVLGWLGRQFAAEQLRPFAHAGQAVAGAGERGRHRRRRPCPRAILDDEHGAVRQGGQVDRHALGRRVASYVGERLLDGAEEGEPGVGCERTRLALHGDVDGKTALLGEGVRERTDAVWAW